MPKWDFEIPQWDFDLIPLEAGELMTLPAGYWIEASPMKPLGKGEPDDPNEPDEPVIVE